MLSVTEENYLKGLFRLCGPAGDTGTNELAAHLGVKPATVNGMLKRLKEKRLVSHERYGRITLTAGGRRQAVEVVRKHRLWETFLHEKLGFSWDEVHEVAEQLEHISSPKLIDGIEALLGHPKHDPHGDPIPDRQGRIAGSKGVTLAERPEGSGCTVSSVSDHSPAFLQQADRLGIAIHTRLEVILHNPFDQSIEVMVNGRRFTVTRKFAEHILTTVDPDEMPRRP
jgi:DtxR family Mn-dependent transcriptional regulator